MRLLIEASIESTTHSETLIDGTGGYSLPRTQMMRLLENIIESQLISHIHIFIQLSFGQSEALLTREINIIKDAKRHGHSII